MSFTLYRASTRFDPILTKNPECPNFGAGTKTLGGQKSGGKAWIHPATTLVVSHPYSTLLHNISLLSRWWMSPHNYSGGITSSAEGCCYTSCLLLLYITRLLLCEKKRGAWMIPLERALYSGLVQRMDMAWDGWTALPGLRQETAGLCPPCSCSSPPYWSLSSILSVCTQPINRETHRLYTIFTCCTGCTSDTAMNWDTHRMFTSCMKSQVGQITCELLKVSLLSSQGTFTYAQNLRLSRAICSFYLTSLPPPSIQQRTPFLKNLTGKGTIVQASSKGHRVVDMDNRSKHRQQDDMLDLK